MLEDARYRRLAAAIILAAVQDAQGGDPIEAPDARRWLRCDGANLAEMLDIPPERVAAWVGGLEPLPYEQLALFE